MASNRTRSVAFPLLLASARLANGALPDPGYWDISQGELDELVRESRPYFRSVEDMGNGAKICNQLPGYTNESAYKLTNATVLVLDQDLLCDDFPDTCDLSRKETDEWILEQAGWFSARHIANRVDAIPHDPSQSIQARRACAGGRTLLLPMKDRNDTDGSEWIDVKGLGATAPKMHVMGTGSEHSNGLFSVFEALYEFLNDKTMAAVLKHHSQKYAGLEEQKFHTVGVYAVISLGFVIPYEIPSKPKYYAAAGLVRQASRRSPNPHGWMAPKEAEVLEQILNSYGIRSDGPANDINFKMLPNPTCRRFNLQGTIQPRTVTDFGTVQGDPSPWPPAADDCLVNWGQTDRIVDTPVWRAGGGIGSKRVRDFLRDEYKNLPRTEGGTSAARRTSNTRLTRMWEAEDCWWNGRCSVADVEKAISVGMIDHLLAADSGPSNKGAKRSLGIGDDEL